MTPHLSRRPRDMYEAPKKSVLAHLLAEALHLIAPDPCLACLERRASRHGLCPACRGKLRPVPPGSCSGCGLPPTDPRSQLDSRRCLRCRTDPPPWASLVTPWRYEPPLDDLIQKLKFGGREVIGFHLGSALAEETPHLLEGHDLVVPVPLHLRRRLSRGYNQSELIASALAHRLELRSATPLRRFRSTPPQVGLDRRHRRANVARAFRCTPRGSRQVSGRRILLVDDVVTTGATLGAACRALLEAGASKVTAVAVARTSSERGAEG